MRDTVKVTIVLIAFFILVGKVGWWENHYYRDAKVINTHGTIVTVEDGCGYTWEFESDSIGDYPVGTELKMLMDTRTTDSIISDDIIEKVEIISK